MESTAGPGGPFFHTDTIAGSSNLFTAEDSGEYFYVVGVDGSGNPVSANSNIVQCM